MLFHFTFYLKADNIFIVIFIKAKGGYIKNEYILKTQTKFQFCKRHIKGEKIYKIRSTCAAKNFSFFRFGKRNFRHF